MAKFVEATSVEGEGGRYRARLDADWFAWGPFGGYLAALAMRAVGAESPLPLPATFSGLFLNVGEAGHVDVDVRSLKRGKRAEALRATVVQGERPLFEASVWMIDRGLSGLTHDHARMPEVPPPERVESYRERADDYDDWYPFWQHMEGRPVQWYEPDDRPPPEPAWQGWMRLLETPAPDTPVMRAAEAIMWMDFAGWNAAVYAHPWPLTHIAPTMDLTVQLRASLYERAEPPPWVLVDGACPTGGAGLLGGLGNLWDQDGTLLAAGTSQMMCRPNPMYAQEQAELARGDG